MRYRLLLAVVAICAVGTARLQAEAQAATPEPASMRFEWVKEGPADVCGVQCREWVAASGPITGDTARDFELFSQVRDLRGATVALDSGGGAVLASLDLGRKIRRLGIRTTVGRTVKLPEGPNGDQRVKLSPQGECASMCVFVLLGGVHRTVPADARILVHQIWPGSKRYDASAETYTAEEMVRIQRDVGRIARYTVEMGGDIELFELAMRIPPWERLRALTASELRRLRLQTIEAGAEARTSGVVQEERRSHTAPAQGIERGWTLGPGKRHQSMQRRHTLTIEGEEIGQFELSIACAESGGFKLAYADSRVMSPELPAERLKDVTLRLGGERVVLQIHSSAPGAGGSELLSRASGLVTPEFVGKLRTDPTSVIVVGTRTTHNLRTSIRVGGAGFAKLYPRFEADCGSG